VGYTPLVCDLYFCSCGASPPCQTSEEGVQAMLGKLFVASDPSSSVTLVEFMAESRLYSVKC